MNLKLGCTIIPIQSSQEEILDFTSNVENSPLATLDYNNKIIVPSVAVILVKETGWAPFNRFKNSPLAILEYNNKILYFQ